MAKHGNMSMGEMQELFDWIDRDKSGAIEINEFLTGFRWVTEPLSLLTLMKMHETFVREATHLQHSVTQVVESRCEEYQQIVKEPLMRVSGIARQLQRLDAEFGELLGLSQ